MHTKSRSEERRSRAYIQLAREARTGVGVAPLDPEDLHPDPAMQHDQRNPEHAEEDEKIILS